VPAVRRRSPLRWLLLALIGLSLLALAGLVLVNLTKKPAEVAYANDDYQVPAAHLDPPRIPIPETLEQGKEWMVSNALYAQLAPAPVRCNEPPIDVATASDAALKAHFENLMECLVRVWQPPLTQAGFQIFRPTVTIYIEEITTKCGSGKFPQNAFYCGADQQIYWSNTLGRVLTPFRESKYAGDYVMSHEFGHAIQGRTGILTSRNWLLSETADKAERLQLRRRTEVQADCFAGMFLRSVSVSRGLTQADADALQRDFYNGGDDVLSGDPSIVGDHGRGVTRQFWGTTGLSTSEAGKCNSFVAPPNHVR
jgi:predicted metalloprotease